MSEFVYDLYADNAYEFVSSAIDTLAYNRENNELYIEFTSGGEYIYDGVLESTYNLFVKADSLGKFYRNNIQGTFTSRDATGTWLAEREDEDEVDLHPETKFISGDDFEATIPVIAPSRFGVKYTVDSADMPHGPFEPTFEAISEADALLQWETALDTMGKVTGLKLTPRLVAVTHYFD